MRVGLIGGGMLLVALAMLVSSAAFAGGKPKGPGERAASLEDLVGVDFFHNCNFTHKGPDDPIVFPGKPGASPSVGVSPYVRRLLPGVPARAALTVLRAGDPFRPNIVPDECSLTIELRFVSGQQAGVMLREARTRLAALRRQDPTLRATIRKKYGFVLDPVVTRPDEPKKPDKAASLDDFSRPNTDEDDLPVGKPDEQPAGAFDGSEFGFGDETRGDPYLGALKADLLRSWEYPEMLSDVGTPVGCIHMEPDGKIEEKATETGCRGLRGVHA